MDACCWIGQIGEDGQHIPQNRHGSILTDKFARRLAVLGYAEE
jgi:hypothetical protein